MALQRHDELTEALKQARIALEQAESTMSADHAAAPVTPEAVEPVPPTPPQAIPAATQPAPAEVVVTGADDAAQLTDGESQLFSEAYFRVALDARIASARRHLRPVAVALLDLYEGVAGADIAPAEPARAAESIRETVRDADTACRLADGTYAVILEDTPENGAVWTVERVRRNLVSRHGSHTMWAGVACYPAHAFSADELLEQARVALVSAREWNQDRIEVAVAD
jgi:two-component system cell cycle response regulator